MVTWLASMSTPFASSPSVFGMVGTTVTRIGIRCGFQSGSSGIISARITRRFLNVYLLLLKRTVSVNGYTPSESRMVTASCLLFALTLFAASCNVFSGCDFVPGFVSLPVLTLTYNCSADDISASITSNNVKKYFSTMTTFFAKLDSSFFQKWSFWKQNSHSKTVPVLLSGDPGKFFKKTIEIGGVGEIELIGDLLYGAIAPKLLFYFGNQPVMDHLLSGKPA